jgi:hypothetical protein
VRAVLAAQSGARRGPPAAQRLGRCRRAVLLLLLLATCRSAPAPSAEPDPDRAPDQARPLELGAQWTDSVECRAGDCADWFALELPGSGELELELDLEGLDEDSGALHFALLDAVGVPLARLQAQPAAAGGWQLRHRARVRRGRYRFAVLAGAVRRRVAYRLRSALAGAAPPPPRTRPRR